MTQIKISAAVAGSRRKRTWRCTLPASWAGLPGNAARLRLLRILATQEGERGRLLALQQLLRLPQAVFLSLSAVEVAEMLSHVPWLELKPNPAPIVPVFRHNGINYYLPKEKFADGIVMEYAIADEYFMSLSGGNADAARLLVATLCRPAAGGQRQPLLARKEIEQRAAKMTKLPPEITTLILLYWAGVKQYVYDTYKDYIFVVKDEDEEPSLELEQDTGDIFGWWGVCMTVAEQRVFGNLEAVHQVNFHTFCMYLYKKGKESADLRRQMKGKNLADSKPADFY